MTKLGSHRVVTKFMSEINFVSSASQADVIEIGLQFISLGRTSITFKCEVRNLFTKKTIISIERIVFVNVDKNLTSTPHGKTFKDLEQEAIF
jgi:acyl-CoA thioesterase YciA